MLRIIKRAGLESCPKLYHNLRASRETAQFPRHVVCQWIGNSQVIAATHYLQVTDNHFAEAVEGSAQSAAHVKQVVKQQAATSDCPDSQETKKARVNRANCMPVQLAALPCSQTKYPQGETHNATETEGKRHSLAGGGGTGGDIASDWPELQAIIDAWPSLPDDVKASVLAMAVPSDK